MNHCQYAIPSLTAWREARGDGNTAMEAVLCVIKNRCHKTGLSPMAVCVKRLAFSSMTAYGDPELTLYPSDVDAQWIQVQLIAQNVLDGITADITGGATLYLSPAGMAPGTTVPYTLPDGTVIQFPKGWNQAAVEYACTIGSQVFFREV